MRLISIKTELKKQVIYNNPQHFWSWFKQNLYMILNYPSREAIEEFMKSFKIHLFNYINLMRFLENPEKDWIIDKAEQEQLSFKW